MRLIPLLILLLIMLTTSAAAALPMRPYSGIGVLRISAALISGGLPLYDEPGLGRSRAITSDSIQQLTTWLFGPGDELYLLVTARKDDWVRVEYDDAGREAWLQKTRHLRYVPWELFLKGKEIIFLRNAPKNQALLCVQPSTSSSGAPLTSPASMKVIQVQGDWCFVLQDKSNGWIRWRDHDGRLLIGLAPLPAPQTR